MAMASANEIDPGDVNDKEAMIAVTKKMLVQSIFLFRNEFFDTAIDGLEYLEVGLNWRAYVSSARGSRDDWHTPLTLAASLGYLSMVHKLLKKGADPDLCCRPSLRTPLHEAAANGFLGAVECLIQHGCRMNQCDAKGWTPLHAAAEKGQTHVVLKLIEFGADPKENLRIDVREITAVESISIKFTYKARSLGSSTFSPFYDWNSLFLAVHFHHPHIVAMLIEKDFKDDLNFQNQSGSTVLHESVNLPSNFDVNDQKKLERRYETIELLLKSGADPNIKDCVGKTPLHVFADHIALSKGFVKNNSTIILTTFCQFLQYGVDLSISDFSGRTVCHQMAAFGDVDTVKELLRFGASRASMDNDGNTPAHVAAYHGNFDALLLLLDLNGNKEQTNHYGETVFHAALKASRKESEILEVTSSLRDHFDKNSENIFGETVCSLAMKRGFRQIVLTLADDDPQDESETLLRTEETSATHVFERFKNSTDEPAQAQQSSVVERAEKKNQGKALQLDIEKDADMNDHLMRLCHEHQLGKIHMDKAGKCHERCAIAVETYQFVQSLLDSVAKEDERFCSKVLATGSAFEGFRISKPDEFDFMNEIQSLSEETCDIVESDLPGFVRIQIKDAYRCTWKEFISDVGYLDSGKLKSHLNDALNAQSNSLFCSRETCLLFNRTAYDKCKFCEPLMQTSKAGIKMALLWRGTTYPLMLIDVDVTPAIRFNGWPKSAIIPPSHVLQNCPQLGYHVIPKSEGNDPLLWRLSFSIAELTILQNVNSVQGACYTILKLLKEQSVLCAGKKYSHLGFLHTYVLKSKFFKELENCNDKELWLENKLVDRVGSVLTLVLQFLNQTEKSRVESYFLPGYNVLGVKDKHIGKVGSSIVKCTLLKVIAALKQEEDWNLSTGDDGIQLNFESVEKEKFSLEVLLE